MAKITITITGTDGFQIARSFATADDNIPAIVAAYASDPGIPSALGADGKPAPRDAEWAIDTWIAAALKQATDRATQYKHRIAAEAAIAAVPAVEVIAERTA